MIYSLFKDTAKKKLAVLVDPDRQQPAQLTALIEQALNAKVDFFFVGGSLLLDDRFEKTITQLKGQQEIPVVIFPGNNYQVSKNADALLLLSLVSGRNADFLIGQHVIAAPHIKQAKLETISTAYLLIDGGRISTTSYMTQTVPIPADKPDVAVATVMAAEMLGMQMIYLEAGSGAMRCVPTEMVRLVKKNTDLPVVVGGGIKSGDDAEGLCIAGADVVVVGNVLEKSPELLMEISLSVHAVKKVKE